MTGGSKVSKVKKISSAILPPCANIFDQHKYAIWMNFHHSDGISHRNSFWFVGENTLNKDDDNETENDS